MSVAEPAVADPASADTVATDSVAPSSPPAPIASETAAIEVVRLSHTYKKHRALQRMEFNVAPGEIHGFVGPNGAGKTTTLKIICTLMKPQQGAVRVFGRDVVRQVHAVRSSIGFMPDHFSMYRQMSVHEYLDFFGAAYGLPTKTRDGVIKNVLELTDMDGRQDDLIKGLSRGMTQRVGLARVLINDPSLLLLDEPASGLDPRARIELMDILRALKGMGKTVFISSHILSELAELCDAVTIVDRGTTKFSGSIDELLSAAAGLVTYRVVLDPPRDGAPEPENLSDDLQAIPGVTEVRKCEERPGWLMTFDRDVIPVNEILGGVIALGLPVVGFAEEKKHLNRAFMELTAGGVREA
ncbi:ABC transporter ATP-binding protein [Alienimonas chondri]|uniref:Vitamin B12 import ATP-binding protein BtuD n=1 Tax=Alienimonas chondri TaxID=2681879 RepID=A0ABX1VDM6_9PLAN|nr:ABC transporter ATP-binding protein [Alienimonas chondri]NNJ25625.1 Vitamin B12 import ATP-binding protein BtuD [Alienimonas chondri]